MQPTIDSRGPNTPVMTLEMPYQRSLEPIPREELDAIRCFFYINPRVAEEDLEQFDNWFIQLRRKPAVYSTSRSRQVTFHALIEDVEVPVDWRIYRTWENTFHLRYELLLKQFGLKTTNPFVHPEKQFLIAVTMQKGGLKPKALADCILPDVLD